MSSVRSYAQSLSMLNTLNRNYKAMNKNMNAIATGNRINTAADDPSGWAIGQRMDVEIRGLEQANRNAQTGSSLLKIAGGALSSVEDILTTLKEKAIEAASDTATDKDRAAIQELFNQYIDQIDDSLLTTYNGMYLFDGGFAGKTQETNQTYTNQSLGESTQGTSKLTELTNRTGDSLNIVAGDTITLSYVKDGKTHTTDIKIDENTELQDIFKKANDEAGTAIFDLSAMDGSSYIGVDASGTDVYTASGKNAFSVKMAQAGTDGSIGGFTLSVTGADGNIKKGVNASLDAFSESIAAKDNRNNSELNLQTATDANMGIKMKLGRMNANALGLKGKDGTILDVTSREGANAAINVLENALQKVLDQQTTIGAYQSRLEYTSQNLIVQAENVTNAQTVLLGADIAKEITQYAANNTLYQAAQAMLAQSNQNMGWYLNLLK